MFTKLIFIAALAISCASAKPGVIAPVAYSAPLLAAPTQAVLNTQSTQVVGRSYAAPLAYTAAAAPPALAYTAPVVAKVAAASPLAYAAAPLAYTAAAAYAAPYAAAPFASPYLAAAAYRYSPYVL
ncbi:cuticle protein 16.5-like [Aedes albopictus]|uniref:Cuticle protein n=1 Tax=Aedes albopictus TaxID=7160 RepID=A0ABM1XMF5_AEDAL|nr:cuticle protein 16.5-like [Aedes albopictus]